MRPLLWIRLFTSSVSGLPLAIVMPPLQALFPLPKMRLRSRWIARFWLLPPMRAMPSRAWNLQLTSTDVAFSSVVPLMVTVARFAVESKVNEAVVVGLNVST